MTAASSPSILVVDDHPHVAKSICSGLAGEGYSVRHTSTGDEGRALAGSGDYDVIVLDVMLPGTGGLEVSSELRP